MNPTSTVHTQPAPPRVERYDVRPGDERADAALAVRVWCEGGFAFIGDAQARYQWFYLDNPAGSGQLNFLFGAQPVPVGFLGVGPRRFSLRDELVCAGMLVDFVVHPDHRTAAPALILQRAGRARAAHTMPFVYGLPDTKAVMVFKRLGAEVRFDLPTYARVVRSKNYLARHLPAWLASLTGAALDAVDRSLLAARLFGCGLTAQWLDAFDDRFDRLWRALPKHDMCVGVRDRAFLEWRFGRQPGRHYRTFAVSRRGRSELLAYFVCEARDGVLNVKDCLCVGTERELLHGLLMLVLAVRSLPVSVVHLQVATRRSLPRALHAAFFRQRSSRPFFAMVQDSIRAQVESADWYITQADEDI